MKQLCMTLHTPANPPPLPLQRQVRRRTPRALPGVGHLVRRQVHAQAAARAGRPPRDPARGGRAAPDAALRQDRVAAPAIRELLGGHPRPRAVSRCALLWDQ